MAQALLIFGTNLRTLKMHFKKFTIDCMQCDNYETMTNTNTNTNTDTKA